MKIVIVHNSELNAIPPVRNLVDVLLALKQNIVLVSRDKENAMDNYEASGVKIYRLKSNPNNILGKALLVLQRRRQIREVVKYEMRDGDLLWAVLDKTAIDIGIDLLENYNSVIQLLELTEDIPLYTDVPLIMANLQKYAKATTKIVVPEYNRAHILKAWWNLKTTPIVLPNKPYKLPPSDTPAEIKSKLTKLINEKRKVLLYQGDFNPDRDLEIIADTVEYMKDYALYLLGRPNKYLDNLLSKKNGIEYIGYIQPPYHICAARYAHIGLLPYKPSKNMKYCSELNALYCAPNKIHEYASQGLPMIGPDIPGLKFPFELYKIGECYQENSISSVVQAIHKIETGIEEYKSNCLKFWDSQSIVEIIKSIISDDYNDEH